MLAKNFLFYVNIQTSLISLYMTTITNTEFRNTCYINSKIIPLVLLARVGPIWAIFTRLSGARGATAFSGCTRLTIVGRRRSAVPGPTRPSAHWGARPATILPLY